MSSTDTYPVRKSSDVRKVIRPMRFVSAHELAVLERYIVVFSCLYVHIDMADNLERKPCRFHFRILD